MFAEFHVSSCTLRNNKELFKKIKIKINVRFALR
jgi:hypothetical protein